jgi:hypothetical protein
VCTGTSKSFVSKFCFHPIYCGIFEQWNWCLFLILFAVLVFLVEVSDYNGK